MPEEMIKNEEKETQMVSKKSKKSKEESSKVKVKSFVNMITYCGIELSDGGEFEIEKSEYDRIMQDGRKLIELA